MHIPAEHLTANYTHQSLYFETIQCYYASEDSSQSFYVTKEQAEQYVHSLVNDREMFPYCGAGDFINGNELGGVWPQTGIPVYSSSWTKDSSPWSTPRECVWPIDHADTRVCTLSGTGLHSCGAERWCGSNYDQFGNERFTHERVMQSSTFICDLNWGLTQFDSIGSAFLTIFQCITTEGWSSIMYQVQDAYQSAVASIYFIFLIMFGSFFLLNLTLAVIWDSFNASQKSEAANRKVGCIPAPSCSNLC